MPYTNDNTLLQDVSPIRTETAQRHDERLQIPICNSEKNVRRHGTFKTILTCASTISRPRRNAIDMIKQYFPHARSHFRIPTAHQQYEVIHVAAIHVALTPKTQSPRFATQLHVEDVVAQQKPIARWLLGSMQRQVATSQISKPNQAT
jgi:hypothetical protein